MERFGRAAKRARRKGRGSEQIRLASSRSLGGILRICPVDDVGAAGSWRGAATTALGAGHGGRCCGSSAVRIGRCAACGRRPVRMRWLQFNCLPSCSCSGSFWRRRFSASSWPERNVVLSGQMRAASKVIAGRRLQARRRWNSARRRRAAAERGFCPAPEESSGGHVELLRRRRPLLRRRSLCPPRVSRASEISSRADKSDVHTHFRGARPAELV